MSLSIAPNAFVSEVTVRVPATDERITAVVADRFLTVDDLSGILSLTEMMLIEQALTLAAYRATDREDSWAWTVLSNKFRPAADEAEELLAGA